jgi:hypothetical protein
MAATFRHPGFKPSAPAELLRSDGRRPRRVRPRIDGAAVPRPTRACNRTEALSANLPLLIPLLAVMLERNEIRGRCLHAVYTSFRVLFMLERSRIVTKRSRFEFGTSLILLEFSGAAGQD